MYDPNRMNTETPWHRASYDRLMQERLPQLLAERLPLLAYRAEATGAYTCRVSVVLAAQEQEIELTYDDLPQPDEQGLFVLEGQPYVVVPVASQQELDRATIACVGEQLYAYVQERLGQAPPDLAWDEELARAWLPLDEWVRGVFARDRPASGRDQLAQPPDAPAAAVDPDARPRWPCRGSWAASARSRCPKAPTSGAS